MAISAIPEEGAIGRWEQAAYRLPRPIVEFDMRWALLDGGESYGGVVLEGIGESQCFGLCKQIFVGVGGGRCYAEEIHGVWL